MHPRKDGDLAALVKRLFGLVNRLAAAESVAFLHASGLTMPQIVVLYALRRAENTISGLRARLRMSLPATSQLVDRLVEAGLVKRTADEGDRRVRRVTIRPAGVRFLARLGDLRLQEIDGALQRLSGGTRARLSDALAEAVGELEHGLDRPPVARGRQPLDPRRTP